MKFILFRHGETEGNRLNIIQGATVNLPLNLTGIQQAQKLGKKLQSAGIEKFYSSFLIRAVQTATLAAVECGLDVTPVDGMEEVHYGDAEGMSSDAAHVKYAGILQRICCSDDPQRHDLSIPNGETVNQSVQRAIKTLEKIKAENEGTYSCIAVCSHGALLYNLYEHYFNKRHRFANCEYFELEL